MAAGTRVGTGFVSIQPDFSGFQEKVAAKLNESLGPAMDRAGKKASQRLSKSLGDDSSLRSSFRPILKRFEKEGDKLGEVFASKIGKGAKRAEGDMFGLSGAIKEMEKHSSSASSKAKILANDTFGIAHAARDAGQGYKLLRNATSDWGKDAKRADVIGKRLTKGVSSLARDVLDVGRNLKASAGGFGNFEGIMARANRGFQFFRNILGSLKIPTIAAGIALLAQSLSALAAGAFATASALGPLSGALVAIPALALAGAQAVGTLKLALSGIGDAVKAGLAVQIQGGEQAVQTLRQQENAAEAVADAHRTLASAERDAEYATEDLTKARKDATDQLHEMERASRESRLTEQEGSLALREARRELNKTLREPSSTGFDIRAAEQAVERAKFGLEATREEAKKARKDYAEAQKKGGVSGMPEVVSARRAQADADRSVADAERGLAKAERDNTDAMKQQGSAATALQQKMAELTPAGRKFAKFLISLKPRYDELRETASKGFFPGAESGLKSAMKNFGVFKGIIGETSSALGDLASQAGQKLGSEAWGRDLGKIGAEDTQIIERLGQAGLNLGDAFRNVLVAAEPLLDWMSEGTVKFSEWLKTASQTGRETGSLSHFFEETREAMERVWRILKPLGEGLLNVGHAAKGLGNEILDSLGDAAQGWADWTKSTEGQNKLKNYFKEVKPTIFAIGRLVRDLTDDFFELGRQKGVATLIETIRTTLLPIMTRLSGATTGWLSGFIGKIGDLRKEGVPLFDAFAVVLAEHAAQAGAAIAKALFNAFVNSSVWGKLAIGGWLFSKVGGFSILGQVIGAKLGGAAGSEGASVLASTLGKALGPALGAVGIANIITSATKGDWRDAGFEAGGALAGGIAGGLLGGPLGAAAGVGIGSVLGEALSGLFKTEKKLSPLQERLAETTRNLADALRDEKHASEATAGAEESVKEARRRAHGTTASLLEAENDLDHARKTHGAGSLQAIRNEERVKAKREGNRKATEELQFSEEVLAFSRKAEGRSIAQVVHDSTLKVAADKQRLEGIKRLIQTEGFSTEASEKWSRASKKYTEDLATRNEALKQARHRNKDWADSLEEMTAAQHRFGQFGGALATQIENLKSKIVELRKRGAENGGPMNPLNKSLQDAKGELRTAQSRLLNLLSTSGPKLKAWALQGGGHVEKLGGSFESLSGSVSESLDTIQKNVSGMLKSFGIGHVPKFTVKYLHAHAPSGGKKYLNQLPEFATGGLAATVPGNTTGDRHVLSLGGRPVAKVESGEGIFVGNRRMMAAAKAANDAVPRFQEGGLVGGIQQLRTGGLVEPKLEGSAGALKQLGQAAIKKVYEGAKGYLAKHRVSGIGGSVVPIGHGIDMLDGKPVADWIDKILIAARRAGVQFTVSSGYRTDAEQLAIYESGVRPAAVPKALGGSGSNHEGVAYPAGAVDISPGAEALAAWLQTSRFAKTLIYAGAKDPVHFSHPHDGGYQKGGLVGLVQRLQGGGRVKGIWDGTSIDKTYPKSDGYTGEVVPPYVIQALAEWAGLPGLTMYQITEGESSGHAGMDIPDPPGRSRGLYAINDHYNPQFGATAMRNPILNTLAAKRLVGSGLPNANIWHGSSHVTGWNLHYNGDPEAIARHIGGGESSEGAKGAGEGKGKKPAEKALPSYAGVSTSAVTFGHPKTLKATDRELDRLIGKDGKSGLLSRYRHAANKADKDGKHATADLLKKRVFSIEQRVAGLRKQRRQLRMAEAGKALKKRISGKLAKIAGYDQRVEGAQGLYEHAAEYAEHVVGLEPESPEVAPEPELPDNATDKQRRDAHNEYERQREGTEKDYVARYSDYIEKQEGPAYQGVLERVADWRNTILRAETHGFGEGSPSIDSIERGLEHSARHKIGRIDQINDFTKKVGERVREYWDKVKEDVSNWRSSHQGQPLPEGLKKEQAGLPDWLQAQVEKRDHERERLPSLRNEKTQLETAIGEAREAFFAGGDNRLVDPPTLANLPLPGSGTFEGYLEEVQGNHPFPELHEILDAGALAPPRDPSKFGGVIWGVQESIEGLGLKIRQAGNSVQKASIEKEPGPDNTERLELELELARNQLKRDAVEKALGPVLGQFNATYPLPFAGTFHTGGTVDVPGGGDAWAHVRDAEHILTPEQMAALSPASEVSASSAPVIESLVIHHDGSATMRYEGREFETAVREVVRSTPRGLGNSGAGRAFRP